MALFLSLTQRGNILVIFAIGPGASDAFVDAVFMVSAIGAYSSARKARLNFWTLS